jgi:NADPH2:quinone reductase
MDRVVRLSRSTVIDAPIDAIWRLLRDFNSHESWHPAIATSRIEASEPADSVGAVRVFQLSDGSTLREQLIALSDRERQLTYCLLEAPLPLMEYVATLRLRQVTEGDRTFVTWESRFRPPEERADELSRLVAIDIYEAGFRALKQKFEDPHLRSATPTPKVRIEPNHPPHAEAPAEGGPRSTQDASLRNWTILRGGSDYVGPAPQDEGGGLERGGSPRPLAPTVGLGQTIQSRAIVVPRYGG